MDGTWGDNAKLNKSERERQLPDSFLFMWNIEKKKNQEIQTSKKLTLESRLQTRGDEWERKSKEGHNELWIMVEDCEWSGGEYGVTCFWAGVILYIWITYEVVN